MSSSDGHHEPVPWEEEQAGAPPENESAPVGELPRFLRELAQGLTPVVEGREEPRICVRQLRRVGPPATSWTPAPEETPQVEVCRSCPLGLKSLGPGQRQVVDRNERRDIFGLPPCKPAFVLPIRRRQEVVGLITLRRTRPRSATVVRFEAAAAAVGAWFRQGDLQRRARRRFGRDLWLVGRSAALADLHSFADQAAQVELSVLLYGEAGSGREDAGRAIHLLGPGHARPFVKLDTWVLTAENLAPRLLRDAQEARGGTLFLASVDELDPLLQSQLVEMMDAGWPRCALSPPADAPRILASAGPPVEAPRLHPRLREELSFLSHEVAPLRRRREDIVPLAHHFLEAYGNSHELAPAVAVAFESFPWPGNVRQLRRTVAQLAAFAGGRVLALPDVRDYLPGAKEPVAVASPAPRGRVDSPAMLLLDDVLPLEGVPTSLHPALQRALEYLSRNFTQEITVATLARRAYVSPSHLFHLFKESLRLSPMSLLLRLRIARAQELLVQEPGTSITEVASQSGFGDLRHFQRTFKRLVGAPPREFRQSVTGGPRPRGRAPWREPTSWSQVLGELPRTG